MDDTKRSTVEFFEDEAGGWRWRLKAANGEIVAVGESYTRYGDAVRGWTAARDAAFDSVSDEPVVP